MKVFRFYPWEGISQISLAQGEAITFITMFGVPCILHRHHTGVEYCLFVQGFARASSQIDEYAPHFLCLPAARSIGQKKIRYMEKQVYQTPKAEVIVIVAESFICESVIGGSGSGFGGGEG